MRLLLHAIGSADSGAPPLAGLRGQACVCLEHAGLAAWATPFRDAPTQPFGRAELLEHHAIVSRLAADVAAILPARFATWLADEEALRGELTRRRVELVKALERVRGRAEIAVTAVWTALPADSAPPAAATPGRRYLLARQQVFSGTDTRRQRARALAAQVEGLVGPELVDVRHQICPSPTVAVSSALLVRRQSADEIKGRLTRAEQDVRILVNGPWPPYTFATVV